MSLSGGKNKKKGVSAQLHVHHNQVNGYIQASHHAVIKPTVLEPETGTLCPTATAAGGQRSRVVCMCVCVFIEWQSTRPRTQMCKLNFTFVFVCMHTRVFTGINMDEREHRGRSSLCALSWAFMSLPLLSLGCSAKLVPQGMWGKTYAV